MLFNSQIFIFAFLPAALAIYALAACSERTRLPTLFLLSLAFYSYWDIRFAPLLLASIALNWLAARAYIATRNAAFIWTAVALDLALLALFKYADFLGRILHDLSGLSVPVLALALPLGISFFSFHHIMYLVDLRAGRAPPFELTRYALYIAFFPQVLAGPLVRYSEVMHQFARPYFGPGLAEAFGRGLVFFALGLAKKVFLGDPLGALADPLFAKAAGGLGFVEAWKAVLAFALQIYFDFSGYSDMAVGLGLLFGVGLPQNFDAPYRAVSLQEFWRRWHMTLSRFLRDYVYIRLGGNRRGLSVQLGALLATMALGGLWHGAGWTFVIWGVLHGVGLGAGVVWRRAGLRMPDALGWALTLLFVLVSWVFFRANSLEGAVSMLQAMVGGGGVGAWTGSGWRTIALAGVIAVVGPTAWQLAWGFRPQPATAVLTGLLIVAAVVKLGGEKVSEFIYFQF
jgi:D-alanyl-lipoteichoic acid acyltransferase DltB (MBOAT superfamily)